MPAVMDVVWVVAADDVMVAVAVAGMLCVAVCGAVSVVVMEILGVNVPVCVEVGLAEAWGVVVGEDVTDGVLRSVPVEVLSWEDVGVEFCELVSVMNSVLEPVMGMLLVTLRMVHSPPVHPSIQSQRQAG